MDDGPIAMGCGCILAAIALVIIMMGVAVMLGHH
jgi:hypothetical protein